MVWWVRWGHKPNMCFPCVGSRGGRSWVVMWCFGMRHLAPWRMMVVCVGLASFGASRRVSSGTGPVTRGMGSPLGCFHVLASQQSVPRCSCSLYEILAEEAVLRPFGKL